MADSLASWEKFAIGEDDFPRPDLPADENARSVKGITLEKLFRLLRRVCFVDDQGAVVVRKRSSRGNLALLQQALKVLPVRRPDRVNLGLVLRIFNDRG